MASTVIYVAYIVLTSRHTIHFVCDMVFGDFPYRIDILYGKYPKHHPTVSNNDTL